MNATGTRFICLLLTGAAIITGSILILQSYSRLNLSSGLGGNLHIAQMEMISAAVLIAGGLVSLAILAILATSSSSRTISNDHRANAD